MEGLHGCPLLSRLWLTENRISELQGLGAASGLRELYLTSNRITAMRGLEQLSQLKVCAVCARAAPGVQASVHGLPGMN